MEYLGDILVVAFGALVTGWCWTTASAMLWPPVSDSRASAAAAAAGDGGAYTMVFTMWDILVVYYWLVLVH